MYPDSSPDRDVGLFDSEVRGVLIKDLLALPVMERNDPIGFFQVIALRQAYGTGEEFADPAKQAIDAALESLIVSRYVLSQQRGSQNQ